MATHKTQGIAKRISEPVYPADILSDAGFQLSSSAARGAWFWCLLTMWHDKKSSLTYSVEQWSRLWNVNVTDANDIINELKKNNVTVVTKSNADVTLTCRRLERRDKTRNSVKLRVKAHRAKQGRNTPVTPQNPLPSSSSSFSSSSSVSSEELTPLPPLEGGEVFSSQETRPEIPDALKSRWENAWPLSEGKLLRKLIEVGHPQWAIETAIAITANVGNDPPYVQGILRNHAKNGYAALKEQAAEFGIRTPEVIARDAMLDAAIAKAKAEERKKHEAEGV